MNKYVNKLYNHMIKKIIIKDKNQLIQKKKD